MYLIQKHLQKYFLKKFTKKFYNQALSLINQDNLENFLLDKSKLVITDQFLSALQNLENFYLSGGQYQKQKPPKNQSGFFVHARNLLALLSISHNPDEYFHGSSSSKKLLENQLREICPKIIEEIKDNKKHLLLLTLIKKGQQLFREWKNIDHQELINHQIITYWEMEFEKENLKKTLEKGKLDLAEYDAVIEIISDSQKKILSYLKQISPQSAKDIVDGKIKPLFLDIQKIQDTFKQAFWNQLREQLREEPPNYSGTLDLLKEIREIMINLTPRRQDLQEIIRSEVDIELFEQMIRNNAFSLDDLKNIVLYLVDKINQYQSPSMDSEWLKWKTTIEKNLGKIQRGEITLDLFLPTFFEKCFELLEIIRKEIDDFKNFMGKQKN